MNIKQRIETTQEMLTWVFINGPDIVAAALAGVACGGIILFLLFGK